MLLVFLYFEVMVCVFKIIYQVGPTPKYPEVGFENEFDIAISLKIILSNRFF